MSPKTDTTNLENLTEAINLVMFEMKAHDANSAEFAACVDQLEKLFKIKGSYEKDTSGLGLNFEKLLPVIGNLAGIVAILNHERAHVIATKALGFVMKSKV